jgi:hypothetical protein
MSIISDPMPVVVGLDQVLQMLSGPRDVGVTKGKVVILGYFIHMMVPPLLPCPFVHLEGGAMSLDMG